jgi:hypothetical protein
MWQVSNIFARPIEFSLGEVLILIFFICTSVYTLTVYSVTTVLRDTLWENAACRLPALLLLLSWSWSFTVYASELARYDLETLLGGPVLPSADLFFCCKRLTYLFCFLHSLDLLLTANFSLSLVRFDVQVFMVAVFVLGFLNPFDVMYSASRFALINTILSLAISPFSEASSSFWHVLVADVMTSLSKLLADMQVMVCLSLNTLTRGVGVSDMFSEEHRKLCFDTMLTPMVQYLPFLWRLCQCIREFIRTQDSKHFKKGLLYLSVLPVLTSSTLKHHWQDDELRYPVIETVWFACTAFTALLSFYWDVVHDWGLLELQKDHADAIVADRAPTRPDKPGRGSATILHRVWGLGAPTLLGLLVSNDDD